MAERPAVNPNVDDIADRAKHGYAIGTKLLAAVQYRLAELAGTDKLDPDESMRLQENLFRMHEELYLNSLSLLCEICDGDVDWCDTYSDGRRVVTNSCVDPEADRDRPHNRFLLGDGAVYEFPLGFDYHINPTPLPGHLRIMTSPDDPEDIIDHLFDATSGIDALRTVEDDEEEQR